MYIHIQKRVSWCSRLGDFEVSNTIQPITYLVGGVMDGLLHISCLCRERQFRWSQREREPVLERQRLECREPQSGGGSETHDFSHYAVVRVLF